MNEPLETAYDPATWERIERASRSRRRSPRRSRSGAAMVAGAILAGVRDVVGREVDEPEVRFVHPDPIREHGGVTLYFVPDAPAATRALVRPWCLGDPAG